MHASLRRTLVASLLPLAGLGAVAVPTSAQAITAYDYDLKTATTETSGRAWVRGDVEFESRRRVDVRGYVSDICAGDPTGDGYGAYAVFQVVFPDGSVSRDYAARDIDGCDNGRVAYHLPLVSERRIAGLRVTACEINTDGGYRVGDCARKYLDNPKVG